MAKISPDEQIFADSLWQKTVKPIVDLTELCERFQTLIACHDQLVSLFSVMQRQQFNPFLTVLLLNSYIHLLEQAIETLHGEILRQEIIADENL